MSTSERSDQKQIELTNLTDALEAAGIYVAVEIRDGALILSGEVDSAEMRGAAWDLGGTVADRLGLRIEDAIDVLEIELELGTESQFVDSAVTDVSTISELGSVYSEQASEEAIPYFPPIDPVIGQGAGGSSDIEIIGGFQTSSMDEEESDSGRIRRGDEHISDDVRRELREDALTTDLVVSVETRNGIVSLSGSVPSIDDAENAEAVANRVPNVQEVREVFTVRELLIERNA